MGTGSIIITLIMGAVAGWLASIVMSSNGGLIRNIIMGIIGSVVGTFVLGHFGITGSGYLGEILVAAAGACIVIFIGRLIFK